MLFRLTSRKAMTFASTILAIAALMTLSAPSAYADNGFEDLPIVGTPSTGGLAWKDMEIKLGGKECDVLAVFDCEVTDLASVRVTVDPGAVTSKVSWSGYWILNTTGRMGDLHLEGQVFQSDGFAVGDNENFSPAIGSGVGYLSAYVGQNSSSIGIGVKLWAQYDGDDWTSNGARTPMALCADGSGTPPANECRFQ